MNEKDTFNNIVIGKLNTKNIFENRETETEKQQILIGRINTKVDLLSL